MRDEECPICGEATSYDGNECMVCGFVQPPKEFQDPDLELAQKLDLRRDKTDPEGMDVSEVAGIEDSINDADRDGLDDESGLPIEQTLADDGAPQDPALVCPVCGTGFTSQPESVSMEDPMAGSLDEPDAQQDINASQGVPTVPDETGGDDLGSPQDQDPTDPDEPGAGELDNAAEGDVCPACGKGVLEPPGEAQTEMGEDPEAAGELGAPGSKVPGDEPEDGEGYATDDADPDDPDAKGEGSPFGGADSDEEEDPEDAKDSPLGDSEDDAEESPDEEDEESHVPPFGSDDDSDDEDDDPRKKDDKPAGHTPWQR